MATTSFFNGSSLTVISTTDYDALVAKVNALSISSSTAVASVDIPADSLVYVKSDGTLALASAVAEGKEATGFTQAAFAAGGVATYFSNGFITGITGLSAGAPYFLSNTPGAFTATVPTTKGTVLLKIGQAISATTIQFQPETPITL